MLQSTGSTRDQASICLFSLEFFAVQKVCARIQIKRGVGGILESQNEYGMSK